MRRLLPKTCTLFVYTNYRHLLGQNSTFGKIVLFDSQRLESLFDLLF